MPKSRRQRSIATGSGPASTSIAALGPAGNNNASPCPTSHATKSQSGGGHREVTARTGRTMTRAVAAAATSTRRAPTRRHAARTTTAVPSNSMAPAAPPGHGTVAPCSPPR